jgi:hypothetical protein
MQLMRMRIIFSVIMAVLLIAGTTASAMCEMTCLPQAQTGACCAPHAQQKITHCSHSATASFANAHSCEHPQDSVIGATSVVAVPLLAKDTISGPRLVPSPALRILLSSSISSQPSSSIPLRI